MISTPTLTTAPIATMNDPSAPFAKTLARFAAATIRKANPVSVGISLVLMTLGMILWLNTDGAVRVLESVSGAKAMKAAHDECHKELMTLKTEVKDLKTKLHITAKSP